MTSYQSRSLVMALFISAVALNSSIAAENACLKEYEKDPQKFKKEIALLKELDSFFVVESEEGKSEPADVLNAVNKVLPSGAKGLGNTKELYLKYRKNHKTTFDPNEPRYEFEEFAVTLYLLHQNGRLCVDNKPRTLREINKQVFLLPEYRNEIIKAFRQFAFENNPEMHHSILFRKCVNRDSSKTTIPSIGITRDQLKKLVTHIVKSEDEKHNPKLAFSVNKKIFLISKKNIPPKSLLEELPKKATEMTPTLHKTAYVLNFDDLNLKGKGYLFFEFLLDHLKHPYDMNYDLNKKEFSYKNDKFSIEDACKVLSYLMIDNPLPPAVRYECYPDKPGTISSSKDIIKYLKVHPELKDYSFIRELEDDYSFDKYNKLNNYNISEVSFKDLEHAYRIKSYIPIRSYVHHYEKAHLSNGNSFDKEIDFYSDYNSVGAPLQFLEALYLVTQFRSPSNFELKPVSQERVDPIIESYLELYSAEAKAGAKNQGTDFGEYKDSIKKLTSKYLDKYKIAELSEFQLNYILKIISFNLRREGINFTKASIEDPIKNILPHLDQGDINFQKK